MATVEQFAEFFRGYNPSGGGSEQWHMWCQAFVARCSKTYGSFVRDYPTARAARAASGWLNPDPDTAPLGAIGYWYWEPDDDVAIYVGDGIWMRGNRHIETQFGGVALNAGTGSFDHFQRTAGLEFLGWSLTNGGNTVSVTSSTPGRRTAGAAGASGRTIPTTGGNTPTGEIVAGDYGDFDGFIIGQDPYGNGNNVWFRGLYSGAYFYSGAFTDTGTHDLTDLGTWAPVPPPEIPPVIPEPTPEPVPVEPEPTPEIPVDPEPQPDPDPTPTTKPKPIPWWVVVIGAVVTAIIGLLAAVTR